jgi:Homeodomain-like domain
LGSSAADRERLERLVRDRNTPQKVVWRARIVLLASDGLTAEGIAAAVDKSLLTVRRWRAHRGKGNGRAVEGCDPAIAR